MNITDIIDKYFPEGSIARKFYIPHVKAVANFAIEIINKHPELQANKDFTINGALLHDIGITMVNAPQIGCFGTEPYIKHGILGANILEKENIQQFSPVCITHVGTGFTKEEIINSQLPLPAQDMLPITIEEKIICYADKFFSKSDKRSLDEAKDLQTVIKSISKYGEQSITRFIAMHEIFS